MLRRIRFLSLRRQLLVLVLLAVLPGFGAAAAVSLAALSRAEAEAADEVRRAVRLSVRRDKQVAFRAQSLLRAAEDGWTGLSVEAACARLQALPLSTDQGTRLAAGLATSAGAVICAPNGQSPGSRLRPSALLAIERAAASRAFAVGDYDTIPGSATSSLFVAQPLTGVTTSNLFLFASLSLEWFNTLAEDLRLPADSALTIVDGNARVVARYPNPEQFVGTVIGTGALFRLISGPEREGVGETRGVDGVERLYAFAPLEHSPFETAYVAVGIPSAQAFGDARRDLAVSLVALVIAALVTIGAARAVIGRTVLHRIRLLSNAAQRMAAGDMSARVGRVGGANDEVRELAATFDEMAANVQTAHVLEQQQYAELLARDEKLQAASATLEEQRARLDLLSRELLRAQETERQHIARELHDEIGQSLTALKINLQIDESTATGATRTADSIQIINRLLPQIRELSLMLRPPLLHEAGLDPALRYLLDSESQRSGIRMEGRIDIQDARYPVETELAAFRIAQEALNNAVKHARATTITLTLAQRGDDLELTISDDGVGFEPGASRPPGAGFGLLSMRERAVLAGGEFRIESRPGAGTVIQVRIPASRLGPS